MKRGAAGAAAADRDRGQRDAGRQRRRELRADGIADVDHGVLEAGQPEQPLLGPRVALHRAVVVEMVAAQVAERRDPHAHAVHAALVERVRGDFHRDVARLGVVQRPQLAVQRDHVGRRQGRARDLPAENPTPSVPR